jgi:hypothetical protein
LRIGERSHCAKIRRFAQNNIRNLGQTYWATYSEEPDGLLMDTKSGQTAGPAKPASAW